MRPCRLPRWQLDRRSRSATDALVKTLGHVVLDEFLDQMALAKRSACGLQLGLCAELSTLFTPPALRKEWAYWAQVSVDYKYVNRARSTFRTGRRRQTSLDWETARTTSLGIIDYRQHFRSLRRL
jgi:hypothetical protein